MRQVLAQQPVGVLVGAALPRALRIAEVDIDLGCEREATMVGKFLAAVPGQRPAEFARQGAGLLDQRCNDRVGLLVGDLGQDHVARLALDQGHDMAAARARDQVAFPMPRHRAILRLGRPLADRDRVLDLAQPVALEAGVPRAADRALGAQMREQFLLQHATSLDIKAFVDRLVRHAAVLFIREAAPEPARDLRGRPVAAELGRHCSAQARMASQLAGLGAQRAAPRRLIRPCRAVAIPSTVAGHLPANRRRRPAELDRDRLEPTRQCGRSGGP